MTVECVGSLKAVDAKTVMAAMKQYVYNHCPAVSAIGQFRRCSVDLVWIFSSRSDRTTPWIQSNTQSNVHHLSFKLKKTEFSLYPSTFIFLEMLVSTFVYSPTRQIRTARWLLNQLKQTSGFSFSSRSFERAKKDSLDVSGLSPDTSSGKHLSTNEVLIRNQSYIINMSVHPEHSKQIQMDLEV